MTKKDSTKMNQKEKLAYAVQLIEDVGEESGTSTLEIIVKALQILDFGQITLKDFLKYVEDEL